MKVKGSALYEANLKRIEGMIWYNKLNVSKALECFKLSKKLYKQTKLTYGLSLANFSLWFLYKSRISEFIIDTSEEIIFKKSQDKYEKA